MSDRREVNEERPEHSWIPFYPELARELVEGGWRGDDCCATRRR